MVRHLTRVQFFRGERLSHTIIITADYIIYVSNTGNVVLSETIGTCDRRFTPSEARDWIHQYGALSLYAISGYEALSEQQNLRNPLPSNVVAMLSSRRWTRAIERILSHLGRDDL